MRLVDHQKQMIKPESLYSWLRNLKLFFASSSDPPTTKWDYSELELRWHPKKVSPVLWFQRTMTRFEHPVSKMRLHMNSFSVSSGITAKLHQKLDLEAEHQYLNFLLSKMDTSRRFLKIIFFFEILKRE
jgi:hypothetical protein